MKRLNPKTGLPFKSGDERKDGFRFKSYNLKRKPKRDGFFAESWTNPKAFEYFKKRYLRWNNPSKRGKSEINPLTKKIWYRADRRSDGLIFIRFEKRSLDKDGFYRLKFSSFESFHRSQIRGTLNRNKRESKWQVDVNLDYLMKIFPKDFKCPALGIKMQWGRLGSQNKSSPSLDRIDPKKGYLKGNVCWISDKANTIKSNASAVEIAKVAKWYKNIKSSKKSSRII
jgi:hypothetical protein